MGKPPIGGCDAVVNAGFARPKAAAQERAEDYLQSIESTNSLFRACSDVGIANIVHISTRSVYAKHSEAAHREDEAVEPFSFYGAAKAATEALAATYNARCGLHIKTLRLAQLVGANEHRGLVGAAFSAARAGKPLQLWGTGSESVREYLYVRDAASAIMDALDHASAQGVFNVGTGDKTSAGEIVALIGDLFADEGVSVERHPEATVEVATCYMDVSKAERELGWRARWSVAEALAAIRNDAEELF